MIAQDNDELDASNDLNKPLYDEEGYRDDIHLNEAKKVEQNLIEAWVKLAKIPRF